MMQKFEAVQNMLRRKANGEQKLGEDAHAESLYTSLDIARLLERVDTSPEDYGEVLEFKNEQALHLVEALQDVRRALLHDSINQC
jgi:hypothetical protein